jgi:hypothetical protein
MPITEPARPDAPLTQGDILSGVQLFLTKESCPEKRGEPARRKAGKEMALS